MQGELCTLKNTIKSLDRNNGPLRETNYNVDRSENEFDTPCATYGAVADEYSTLKATGKFAAV